MSFFSKCSCKLWAGNIFTVTGRIDGGLSLAGRKNNLFNQEIQPLSHYEVFSWHTV